MWPGREGRRADPRAVRHALARHGRGRPPGPHLLHRDPPDLLTTSSPRPSPSPASTGTASSVRRRRRGGDARRRPLDQRPAPDRPPGLPRRPRRLGRHVRVLVLHAFHGKSPFGATGSGIDLRGYWMGRTGEEWVATRKGRIKHALGITDLPHTHHAGQDAQELARLFDAVLRAPAERRARRGDARRTDRAPAARATPGPAIRPAARRGRDARGRRRPPRARRPAGAARTGRVPAGCGPPRRAASPPPAGTACGPRGRC